MAYDIMSGFQVGQQLAGPNALGIAIQQVLGRVNQIQQAQLENKFRLQQIGAEAQAKFKYDPEAQAKTQAFQTISSMTQPPIPAGRRLKMFQQYGLLPKAPLSLEEIFARSQTESAGRLAGNPPQPKPYSARQEDAIEGIQAAIASSGELRKFLKDNPDIQTGFLHPSMQRTMFGNVMRSVADPRTTQFSQIAFRLQDAYRRYITGVQAGFPEIAVFLPSSIPNPSTQNKDQFLAALDTFEAEVKRNAEQVKRGLKLRGYSDEQLAQTFAALPELSQLQTNPEVESVKSRLRAKYGR